MAKIELDNVKMWESIRNGLWHWPQQEWLTKCIDNALWEHGFEFDKDGHIVSIKEQEKNEPYWYVAKEDYGTYRNSIYGALPLFMKGERTTKEKVFSCCPDITEREFKKYFRLATEEEIPQEPKQDFQKKVDKLVEILKNDPNEQELQAEIHSWFVEPKQENSPILKELEKNGKDELTEFEQILVSLIRRTEKTILTPEGLAKEFAPKLIEAVHKQFIEEACDWLYDVWPQIAESPQFIEDFRKALEKED